MANNPYFDQPSAQPQPRMFNTPLARVVWTLVPALTLGLAAAVPFAVAAVKGVIKPWLASLYAFAEIAVFSIVSASTPNDYGGSPIPGFLMTLLIMTATTHTMLLDHKKISIGR